MGWSRHKVPPVRSHGGAGRSWSLDLLPGEGQDNGMRSRLYASLLVSLSIIPLQSLHAADPLRVTCVGDSITLGAGSTGNPYPMQLGGLFGDKAVVSAFGVSGTTMLKHGDHPYWNTKQFTDALASNPGVVVIMLGTNDTKPQNWKLKEEYAKDYLEMIQNFQALASKPKVFICRPCPVPGTGNFGINEAGVQEEIPMINKLAAETKSGIIDMHAALEATPELLPDRVHPNAEGAKKMAEAAFKAINAVK